MKLPLGGFSYQLKADCSECRGGTKYCECTPILFYWGCVNKLHYAMKYLLVLNYGQCQRALIRVFWHPPVRTQLLGGGDC